MYNDKKKITYYIKMSSSNLVILSCVCNDSTKTGTGSYSITFGKSTDPVRAISVKSVKMRNVFYNVESQGERKNNVFRFTLGGTPYTVDVPRGFYDVNTLLAFLNTEISAILAASGIIPLPTLDDLSYSSLTGRVSITINGNGVSTPFQLDGGVNIPSVNELLGNTEIVSLDTLAPTAYEFDSLVNLGGVDSVYMVSRTINPSKSVTNRRVNGGTRGVNLNLVKIITIGNAPFGGLFEYQSQDLDAESFIYSIPESLSQFDILFTDPEGNPLDLSNSEAIIELQCWLDNRT